MTEKHTPRSLARHIRQAEGRNVTPQTAWQEFKESLRDRRTDSIVDSWVPKERFPMSMAIVNGRIKNNYSVNAALLIS